MVTIWELDIKPKLRTHGVIMNKKMVIVLIILLLIAAASTGCFGEEKKKKPGIKVIDSKGELNATLGWLDSNSNDGNEDGQVYRELEGSIPVFFNGSTITSISIVLNFQDYDSSHSTSDGNSPEDYVEVSIDGFDATGAGTTTCMITLDLKSNETDGTITYLPSELSISVTGKCFSEITYPTTGRPSLIRLYTPDQGVSYDLSAKYEYEEFTTG
jgi:hypothetical protein